jgi:hypothetical protein
VSTDSPANQRQQGQLGRSLRVTFTAGVLAAAMGSVAPALSSQDAPKPMQATANPTGLNDFRFLVGEWHVRHRYLRLKEGGREWLEAEGTCRHRELTDGWANVDEYLINAPSGAYRAVALRAYDPGAGQWAIWWLDERNPAGALDPPVKGRFESDVGTFYSDQALNGKAIRVRFIWSQITSTSAHWEQAYSSDSGRTWETNWIMDFRRTS